jgi:hypothetical protein
MKMSGKLWQDAKLSAEETKEEVLRRIRVRLANGFHNAFRRAAGIGIPVSGLLRLVEPVAGGEA